MNVVLEALLGVDIANEITKRYEVHPLMVNKWKMHAVSLPRKLLSRRADKEREQCGRKRRSRSARNEIGCGTSRIPSTGKSLH
ncbi:MAG: hypothetical protein GF344_04335 [Chitinivibrionales bacterium]|nr:hypothetical protein [Chitinivibrionales bacterium]MBD3356271.1 hypothetical protein [Chitinivibrionales bacterium]